MPAAPAPTPGPASRAHATAARSPSRQAQIGDHRPVVGRVRVAGVIAASAGAEVLLSSRSGIDAAEAAARATGRRFGVSLRGLAGSDAPALGAALAETDVLLACAAAGMQVVTSETLRSAKRLKVAADINAVPPEGIAGVGVMDDSKPLPGTAAVGIGALSVGNVKYQTQHRLLVQMQQAEKAVTASFPEAFALARTVLAEAKA